MTKTVPAAAEVASAWLFLGISAGGVSSFKSAGKSMVKALPRPASLVTLISPPIIWQNLRVIVRPRPVPPNCRVVEASAWVNG